MGTADDTAPPPASFSGRRAAVPPPQPFVRSLANTLKETFFPDDPLRQFKGQPAGRKAVLGLRYFFPILQWGPRYTLDFFKSDLIAGVTIASLAIPQGISYARLANLPPVLGLYSSFVPPLIYAVMGSSRDLAVGTVAVGSLLMASMLGDVASPVDQPTLLGFIVDFLSHPTIVGFMGGAATVVSLQQLKGILGLDHFTHATDAISILRSVFSQSHKWRWESAVLGCVFLFYLLISRYFSKKKPRLFWISAIAPLTSVILGSILVYLTHAEKHGVPVIGYLKKGINPASIMHLNFDSRYLPTAIKTGIVTGIISLAEGIAVGRSFAMFKNYNIDGNKEMIAIGMMNIVGSCSSCYLTTGPFSRSAVNFNAGCKTAVSNIVMAIAVMITLLVLTPLFHYTPLVVLSSIIIAAMLGLIDYEAAVHFWQVDKFDFLVCMGAYVGIVFASIEVGLVMAIGLSILRVLLFVVRPRTLVLGNIPDSNVFRSVDQYQNAIKVPGVLILEIDAPIYFANSNYLRERISRWIDDEEDRIKSCGGTGLQYIILDMTAVGNIDTSGISMLDEVMKIIDRRGLKLALANPGAEVMKKLNNSKFLERMGQEWIFLTVDDAIGACNYTLNNCRSKMNNSDVLGKYSDNV
ncbi:Sulfate transporter 3.1 [Striga hermonthica]|uniref:Sulfate transporter 3.1 n=1 Tax=Striga hermonthica TaxID=68872 RepID=A0A9N7NDL9_STRHE|nr:Sulfate transporter 3.1 [Striga hermonthica]